MDLMSLMIRIGADTKGAEEGINRTQKLAKGLGNGLKAAGKAATVAVGAATVAVGALVKSAVDAYAQNEQLVGGVETLFGASGQSLEEYSKNATDSLSEVGSSTEDIKRLQQELIAAGYDLGKSGADGIYGPKTKKAFEDYKKANKGLTSSTTAEYKKRIKAQNTVLDNSKKAYKTAGMSANEYLETVTGFSSSLIQSLGGDTVKAAEYADKAIIDMSDNANKMGSDIESIKNAYSGFAKGNFTMLDNLKLGYGGTKEEMQRLLDKAGEISGYKYDISSYADIVEAIHVVQTEMGITGTTAKEADTTIQGSLQATKAAWENVMTAIAGGNVDLQESIDGLVESGINTINNIWPVVSNALSGIAELVKQVAPIIAENLPGMVEEILPKLLDAAITLLVGIANALPGLFKVVLEAIGDLFATIKAYIDERNPELGEKIDYIAQAFSNAIDAIVGFWNDTLKPALEEIWTFVTETLAPAISTAWTETIQPAIGDAIDAIVAFWEETLQPAFQAIWEFVRDNIVPVFQSLADKVKEVKDTYLMPLATYIKESFIKAFEALQTFWKDKLLPIITKLRTALSYYYNYIIKPIAEFVKTTFLQAWESIHTFWEEKLSGKIEDLKTAFNDFKDRVLDPVATFISDTFYKAWETISNLFGGDVKDNVGGIGEAFKTLRDKVLRPVLNWINQYLIKGIENIEIVLGGIIDFLTNVFQGNWEGAWDAVVTAFGDIWDNMKTVLQSPLNAIIDAVNWVIDKIEWLLNTVIDGINSALTIGPIPNPFGGYLFDGWSWSPGISTVQWGRLDQIQWMANGGVLGEGGRAVVGELAPEYLTVRNGQAVVTPIKGAGRFGGDTNNITFNVYAQPGQDSEEIARAVQQKIVEWDEQRRMVFA